MTDQPQQFGNADQYIDKAKDYAGKNPDMTRSGIDKVEDFIDQKTGGKYADQIDQAGDWLEGKLGLPNNTNNPVDPADVPAEPADAPVPPTEAPDGKLEMPTDGPTK